MILVTKNKILIVGFILSLLVCYLVAFSETLALKDEYKHLKKNQEISQNLPSQITSLKLKNREYDSILTAYQLNGTSLQNNLLGRVDRYAKLNKLEILKIDEPHYYKEQELLITSYGLTLKGDFNNLLGLIYELEQHSNFGQIVSVEFNKETDYRSKVSHLELSFIIQAYN
ncbi:hypothetical protein [Leeuwenhoekiella sp. H156]|uniref:hypothetical protein n=1 Tax=Leeuwenhoekiella sp. H156 TaxID=3450128 RepID=UPI003FA46FB0